MSAAADSRTLQFLLDGEVVRVADLPPTTTVLEWLREHRGRCGTKEGCNEGDCGACTVVIGELRDGGIRHRAINSCIRLLPTIDGLELVTVESLAAADQPLHPVQQAMVDCHASQCGFCTPGFVMSLFALNLENAAPTRDQVVDALSGNLCRCTGYRPIIDAALAVPPSTETTRWSRRDAQSAARVAALQSIQRSTALAVPGFTAPRTLDELAEARAAQPDATLLAGGTDIGLWITQQLRELPSLIYLGNVAELQAIRQDDSGITVGAAVTFSDAWPVLVAAHPALDDLARRFASPLVNNSATLCGNLGNGSPIGDSMPALIALGARVNLRCGPRSRSVPLDAFYLGYQRKDLAAGEFIVSVTVPHARPGLRLASYKLSKRVDQDISAVCAGFAVTVIDGVIVDARLAFGGMAAIPARAPQAEAALIGQPWSHAVFDDAAEALRQDFQPLSDLRATREYRLIAAGNLLRRFAREHDSASAASLRVSALQPR